MSKTTGDMDPMIQGKFDATDAKMLGVEKQMAGIEKTMVNLSESINDMRTTLEEMKAQFLSWVKRQEKQLVEEKDAVYKGCVVMVDRMEGSTGDVGHSGKNTTPTSRRQLEMGKATSNNNFTDPNADDPLVGRRVKLPLLEEVDPKGWVTRPKTYFRSMFFCVNCMPEVSFHLKHEGGYFPPLDSVAVVEVTLGDAEEVRWGGRNALFMRPTNCNPPVFDTGQGQSKIQQFLPVLYTQKQSKNLDDGHHFNLARMILEKMGGGSVKLIKLNKVSTCKVLSCKVKLRVQILLIRDSGAEILLNRDSGEQVVQVIFCSLLL
ncbi:uncharacterized protein [Euphorbia lathyris]|uniref:uncharacterized protein isoform X1 n=1 Tax=Euphorbia lathyris TaxID=212925 RepID=UPI003313B513